MKPYGLITKILHNHTDYHPKKGYINWWEVERKPIRKKSERQKANKEISKEFMGQSNV